MAPLLHRSVIAGLGQPMTARTAGGEEMAFEASVELEDLEADADRLLMVFTRETEIEWRLTAGAVVDYEGEEFRVLTSTVTRRDGGVEFRCERVER